MASVHENMHFKKSVKVCVLDAENCESGLEQLFLESDEKITTG